MGFSRQEYWSGLLFPPPGDLLDPGIEPTSSVSLHWQEGSLPLSYLKYQINSSVSTASNSLLDDGCPLYCFCVSHGPH